jgi:protease II
VSTILKTDNQFGHINPGVNSNYQTDEFMFYYTNAFINEQVYKYSLNSGKLSIVYETKLTGPKFHREKFEIKRVNAPSEDGEEIPMTIIHKKDLKRNYQYHSQPYLII